MFKNILLFGIYLSDVLHEENMKHTFNLKWMSHYYIRFAE